MKTSTVVLLIFFLTVVDVKGIDPYPRNPWNPRTMHPLPTVDLEVDLEEAYFFGLNLSLDLPKVHLKVLKEMLKGTKLAWTKTMSKLIVNTEGNTIAAHLCLDIRLVLNSEGNFEWTWTIDARPPTVLAGSTLEFPLELAVVQDIQITGNIQVKIGKGKPVQGKGKGKRKSTPAFVLLENDEAECQMKQTDTEQAAAAYCTGKRGLKSSKTIMPALLLAIGFTVIFSFFFTLYLRWWRQQRAVASTKELDGIVAEKR